MAGDPPVNLTSLRPAPEAAPAETGGIAAPLPVLVNIGSGSLLRHGVEAMLAHLADAFAAAGIVARLQPLDGKALAAAVRLAAAPDAGGARPSLLVIAGGDGTVGAAAQALAGSDVALGIVPLGTFNHLARDLHLPLDIAGAVEVIAAGHVAAIDLGEVNGRVFVNNSSIGLYPEMVRNRERQRRLSRRQKWLAMALALWKAMKHPPTRRLKIAAAGWVQPRPTPFAFVGNNLYETGLFRLGRRASLQEGKLCLFLAQWEGWTGLVRLFFRFALGKLETGRDFERLLLEDLTIQTRRPHIIVAHDGEIEVMHSPLHYRSRPGALRVIVPPEPAP